MDDRSTAQTRLRGLDLRDRPRSAARAGDLARRSGDCPAKALDRRDGHARGETRETDRCLWAAVRAKYWTPDADDPLGRLLLIDRVAAPPDRRELALEPGERGDRALRARREPSGRFVEAVDLVVG